MKFTWQNILKLVISLSLGIGIIWYIQKDLTPEDLEVIKLSISNAKWYILFMAAMMGVGAVIFRALRWQMMLQSLNYNPSLITLIRIIFIMYIANLLFPRLGEVLRCTLLQQYEDIPLEKGLGTMVLERMIDVLGMAVIAGLAVLFEKDKFLQMYNNYQTAKNASNEPSILPWILGIGILVFVAVLAYPKTRNFILDKAKGLIDGILSIRNLSNPSLFVFYSFMIYGLYLFTTYIVYFAIDGTSQMSFTSSFLILTTGTLGIGLTQGGLGAFQLLVTNTLDLYGIKKSIGLSYAWISWLTQTLTLIFFGILSWISLIISQRGKKES